MLGMGPIQCHICENEGSMHREVIRQQIDFQPVRWYGHFKGSRSDYESKQEKKSGRKTDSGPSTQDHLRTA